MQIVTLLFGYILWMEEYLMKDYKVKPGICRLSIEIYKFINSINHGKKNSVYPVRFVAISIFLFLRFRVIGSQ